MASELRVTTIANNAGTESVNTTYVINGSAKVFSSITYSGATPTDQNSLNVSSITYQGVGQLDINFTNAFGDTYYAANVSKRNTVNNDSAEVVIRDAAGQVDVRFFENGTTADDPAEVNFVAHGDLA